MNTVTKAYNKYLAHLHECKQCDAADSPESKEAKPKEFCQTGLKLYEHYKDLEKVQA